MLYMLRPVRACNFRHSYSLKSLTRFANSHTRPYTTDQQYTAHPSTRLSVRASGSSGVVPESKHAGMSDWPCNLAALDSARAFIRDAASKGGKVVLAPDRDADGLCAGKMSCSNLANLAPD